jgi:glycosyltransferase involved in cell wall biosynthesis
MLSTINTSERTISVDIVTITKNAENSLSSTLKSVSEQNYSHINHIIIDGKSTDNTLKIINNFNHSHTIIVFPQQGYGISAAFNTAILQSKGDLIIFLNSGDYLVNDNVVQTIVDSYVREKWLWAVGETISVSRNKIFKKYNKQYRRWSQNLFLYKNPICHQSTIYSKKIIDMVGFYDEKLEMEMDYDFNIRVSLVANPNLLNFPVAYYDTTGISSIQVFKHFRIHRQIRKQYFSRSTYTNIIIDMIGLLNALMRFLLIPVKTWF